MLEKMQQSKAEKSSQVCLAKYLLNIHIVLMQLYKLCWQDKRLFKYKNVYKIKLCKLQFSDKMFDGRKSATACNIVMHEDSLYIFCFVIKHITSYTQHFASYEKNTTR